MTTPLPGVPDFLAGFGPQQSDMQSLWVNPLAFFQQRVIFRIAQTSTTTSLPSSGAFTTITYDTVLEDPFSGWSAATHTWEPPAGYSGWYQATCTTFLQAPGVAGIGLQVQTLAAGKGSGALVSVVVPVSSVGAAECTNYFYLVGGQDHCSIQAALQNSGSAVSTNDSASGQQSTFELTWISS